MTLGADLIEILGCPEIIQGEILTVLPSASASSSPSSSFELSQGDQAEARQLLIRARTTDPSYKEADQKKRYIFHSKEKKLNLANTDNWQFTLNEVGRALHLYFDEHQSTWRPIGVAKALLAMGKGNSATGLWELAQDRRSKLAIAMKMNQRPTKVPCPWLDLAVERRQLPTVIMLCQTGMHQSCLSIGLEKALRLKAYDIAEELIRFHAELPSSEELYVAVLSSAKPDFTFIKLWLSAPLQPNRQQAINAMMIAARTRFPTLEMKTALSTLLANVGISAEEAYQLLKCAIRAQNVETMAAISLTVGGTWTRIQGQEVTSAMEAAVQIEDSSLRYRILNFILSAGAKADTSTLRKQLFKDGKNGDIDHIRLLIRFGVSPHHTGADTDLLTWAVANARMDVFHAIMEAEIPPHVASAVVDKISHNTAENTKISIVLGLGQKGATGLPLSRLLLHAVQSSSNHLTRALVGLGAAADYIDNEGANSLYVAVVRGDVALARLLCTTNPSVSVVSSAVRLTFDAFMDNSVGIMFEILSLLVEHGASGDAVERTMIKAIPTSVCLEVLEILLPTGLSLAASGRAIAQAIKLTSTEALDLICSTTDVTTQSLETALMEVIYGTDYVKQKAEILARMAQRQEYTSSLDWILVNPKRKQHPHDQEIIDMLLLYGASVDVGGGVLLVDALESGNKEAVMKLLRRNPNTSSLTTALAAALHSRPKGLQLEFTELLLAASQSDIGQSRTLLQAVQEADPESPDLDLVTLLLEHNARVDHADGEVLNLAAKGLLIELAEVLLAKEPSIATVERAFNTSLYSLEPPAARLQMMELLMKSGVSVNAKSLALVEEMNRRPTNLDSATLLLKYGASVNSYGGLALVHAVRAGLFEQVRLLSSCPGGLRDDVGSRAFQTAREAELGHQQRLAIYELLLSHPIDQSERDAALLAACTSQEHQPTAALLARNEASVEFRNGQALVSIVEAGKVSLLRTVLLGNGRRPSNDTMNLAFQASLHLSNPVRLEICEILVEQGVNAETRSIHLIDAARKQDLDLLALMLGSGDILWDLDQGSLKYAVSHGLVKEVELLFQYSVPDEVTASAFSDLVDHKYFTTSTEIKIATMLLSVGVPQKLRNSALYESFALSSSGLPVAFIKLLLEYDADPATQNGMCFGLAAKKDNLDVFQKLTALPFDLNLALASLVDELPSEIDLLIWTDHCITQHKKTETPTTHDDSLLRLLIERFPDGKTALARLLDQGYDPGYVFVDEDYTDTDEEMTLLIWALFEKDRVSEDVIIELLSRGNQAKPDFICPNSGLSAVHLTALHDRPEVLRHLVDLGVEIDIEDITGRTPLYLATENRSFRCMSILLDANAKPDDGSLHIAARNVDVECISLLKQYGHNVLFPMDLFNGRTPLAELCREASGLGPRWAKSMQEAMKLLTPFPSHSWKFDGKTILHLAIDNPNAAAVILGSFLYLSQVRDSPGKDDDYLFIDTRTGLHYSPTMYVYHLCPNKSEEEKKTLLKSLYTHRFIDRYFAVTGSQPRYATGLPQALRDSILAEKQADLNHKKDLHRAQLLAEHQQKINEGINRMALQDQDIRNQIDIEMKKRRGDAPLQDHRRTQSPSYSHQKNLTELQVGRQRRGAEQVLGFETGREQDMGIQKRSITPQQHRMERALTRDLQRQDQLHEQRQINSRSGGIEHSLALEKRRERELGTQRRAFSAQGYMMEQAHTLQQQQGREQQISKPNYAPGLNHRRVSDN